MSTPRDVCGKSVLQKRYDINSDQKINSCAMIIMNVYVAVRWGILTRIIAMKMMLIVNVIPITANNT